MKEKEKKQAARMKELEQDIEAKNTLVRMRLMPRGKQALCYLLNTTDNLHYSLIFDLTKKKLRNSRKEPFKSSKIPKFG